jgi:Transposase DDE domain group 1
LAGLLRQLIFGRLAGYEDVNDAERLCHDQAMRWVVGDLAITGSAASASEMGQFETKWLCRPENLAALVDLPSQWIDKVHRRRPPTKCSTSIRARARPMARRMEAPTTALASPEMYEFLWEKFFLSVNHLTPLDGFLNDTA